MVGKIQDFSLSHNQILDSTRSKSVPLVDGKNIFFPFSEMHGCASIGSKSGFRFEAELLDSVGQSVFWVKMMMYVYAQFNGRAHHHRCTQLLHGRPLYDCVHVLVS